MLSFKNWSPRFSAVYDLFGNGRTAVKANVSKYVAIMGNGQADLYNPLGVLTDQRTWRDTNNDLFPQYSEIGPSTISNFGTQAPAPAGSGCPAREADRDGRRRSSTS